VGVGLIAIPPELLTSFGFNLVREPFFPIQGGVFHIVMSVAYAMAAWDPPRNDRLIVMAIIAKLMALSFLVAYYLIGEQIITILLSGIGDGLMAAILLWARYRFMRSNREGVAGG
jgi:hypothetical protein